MLCSNAMENATPHHQRSRCRFTVFLFFHKRLCGPLAFSRFHHQPDAAHRPTGKPEAAYHEADQAIQNILDVSWPPEKCCCILV
jgi:hypothetical protein